MQAHRTIVGIMLCCTVTVRGTENRTGQADKSGYRICFAAEPGMGGSIAGLQHAR